MIKYGIFSHLNNLLNNNQVDPGPPFQNHQKQEKDQKFFLAQNTNTDLLSQNPLKHAVILRILRLFR